MIDRGKRNVLGVGVDVVDYEGAVERIIRAGHDGKALGYSALAVHGVMTGVLDPAHKYRLNRLGLVSPDGQPVRWALSLLHGEQLPDRCYGPKVTLLVCERAAKEGLPIYLFGSTQTVVAKFAENLRKNYPGIQIAGAEPSSFRTGSAAESAALDARIKASGAKLVFVGLGCPRQEIFVFEHAEALNCPVLAVGAAFDFSAGSLKQAPPWMQNSGLEWLFRLYREPKRLWRRYLLLNPLYCLMVAAQMLGLKKWADRGEAQPANQVLYI